MLRRTVESLWTTHRAIKGVVLGVLVAAAVAIPGLANLTGSSFDAGDGNLVVNDEALDWANAPNFKSKIDKPTGQTDDSLGNGTKEDDAVPSVIDGSIPNNKSDLTRFYFANNKESNGHDYIYFAWERVQDPSGTTNMDIELNQSSTLSSNGVTPVRTAGDVLFKYDLANGGVNPVLGYHLWVTTGSKSQCEAANSVPCWDKVHTLAGNFEASINAAGSVTDPIPPDNPRTLDIRTFGEAAIDLTAAGILPVGSCEGFGSAYIKSRSSDSFTAAVKDFIAPLNVNISNCGTVNVNKYIDIDEDATKDSPAENNVSPTGSVVSGDLAGWSFTITGPNSFSCTGTTTSSGALGTCNKPNNGGAADLSALPFGTYTIQENANASKTIGNNSASFFNTDPGPAPATPPVTKQVTITSQDTSKTADFGNSCYGKVTFTVNNVPSGQSGLFVRYAVGLGAESDANLVVDPNDSSKYSVTVNNFRKGDSVSWKYGINHGLQNEQTQSVPTAITVSGYPSCAGSGSVNFAATDVTALKYKDMNANGNKDAGEGALQGFKFLLQDSSGNAITSGGNPVTALSGANGSFTFASLAPGTYRIAEDTPPTGWQRTEPSAQAYYVVKVALGSATVTKDENGADLEFGNTPQSDITVTFNPKAKLRNADGTASSTDATKASSISCTDALNAGVGSTTTANTKTTDTLLLNQSSVTCVVTFVDP
jgi:SdrD B-like domain